MSALGIPADYPQNLLWDAINAIPEGAGMPHIDRNVLRDPDGGIFRLEYGRRRHVPDPYTMGMLRIGPNDPQNVDQETINGIPTGPDIPPIPRPGYQQPPTPSWLPPGDWDVITFTSSNSGFPDHGFITLIASSGQRYRMQDLGAPPSKIAEDVAFACLNLHLSCTRNGETIAIPYSATLSVDATVTNREVRK